MKIKFDTEEISTHEAAGLVALLVALHGSSLLGSTVSVSGSWEGKSSDDILADINVAMSALSPAPDGYPVPDAAAAFGAQPTTVASATGEFDKAGIPWDERIHSSTKGTNKDGTWSRRRNTPDEVFNSVMAELKGAGKEATAQEAFNNPTPSADAAAPAIATSTTPPAPTDGPSAPTSASPSDGGPPPPPASAAPITFPMLMVKVTKAQTNGKITKADVDGILATFGIASMPALLNATPDTLAAVNAMVDSHVGQ